MELKAQVGKESVYIVQTNWQKKNLFKEEKHCYMLVGRWPVFG